MARFYSMGDVARLLSVPQHKISYAISNQMTGEASLKVGGKRVFTESDLSRLATYFGVAVAPTEKRDQRGGTQ